MDGRCWCEPNAARVSSPIHYAPTPNALKPFPGVNDDGEPVLFLPWDYFSASKIDGHDGIAYTLDALL
jgi:hypothetical protein